MLKVIGAGLPRTGTTSMKAALERLGFGPCYHMFEVFTHPEFADRWLPLATQPQVDWDQLFDGYQSTQDWPASHFWCELADAYPEAKVVLTVRDPHRWYPSLRTLLQRGAAMAEHGASTPDSPTGGMPPAIDRMRPLLTKIGQHYFGPDFAVGQELDDEDVAVAAFERHTTTLRESLPADRLLVFDVRQGWDPLCAFLGVPVPEEPFPHLNDSDWMGKAFQHLHATGQMPTPFRPSQ